MSAARVLDDLARTLAQPMPRRRAIRVVGGSLALALVPGLRPALAAAGGVRSTEGCETAQLCPPGNGLCGFTVDADQTGTTKACIFGCCVKPGEKKICCKYRPPGEMPHAWCCDAGETCADPVKDGALCKKKPCGEPLCGRVCCRTFGGYFPFCCGRSRETGTCCGPEQASKEGKEICNEYALRWNHIASQDSIVAALLAKFPATAAIAALQSGVAWKANAVLSSCAADPPDRRYRSIAKPPTIGFDPVRAGNGISTSAAHAVNELTSNQARAYALIAAWVSSLERSQGAAAARDRTWARRQEAAAATYASQAASALRKERRLRTAAQTALVASNVREVILTVEDVRAAQTTLAAKGLPALVRSSSRKAGLTERQAEEIGARLQQADPETLAGPILLKDLRDGRRARLTSTLADELERYVRKAKASPL